MKLSALALLLLLTTLMPAAQPAPRAVDLLLLYGPPKGSTIELPDVVFTWAERPDATSFDLAVWNVDGSQKVVQNIPNAGCDGTCSNVLDLDAANWRWKEGATYRWQVKARTGGILIAKSKKSLFTTDMLRRVTLEFPADGETVVAIDVGGEQEVPIGWTYPTAAEFTWLGTLYNESGAVVASTMFLSPCAITCSVDLDVTGLVSEGETVTFFWKVTGTNPYIKGKAKSPKYMVKVYNF